MKRIKKRKNRMPQFAMILLIAGTLPAVSALAGSMSSITREAAREESYEDDEVERQNAVSEDKEEDSESKNCDIDPNRFAKINLNKGEKTKFEYTDVETVILPEVEKEGYTFLYWTNDPDDEDAEIYEAGTTYTVKSDDDKLYAVFEDEDGNITIKGKSGNKNIASPSQIEENADIEEETEPAKNAETKKEEKQEDKKKETETTESNTEPVKETLEESSEAEETVKKQDEIKEAGSEETDKKTEVKDDKAAEEANKEEYEKDTEEASGESIDNKNSKKDNHSEKKLE